MATVPLIQPESRRRDTTCATLAFAAPSYRARAYCTVPLDNTDSLGNTNAGHPEGRPAFGLSLYQMACSADRMPMRDFHSSASQYFQEWVPVAGKSHSA